METQKNMRLRKQIVARVALLSPKDQAEFLAYLKVCLEELKRSKRTVGRKP